MKPCIKSHLGWILRYLVLLCLPVITIEYRVVKNLENNTISPLIETTKSPTESEIENGSEISLKTSDISAVTIVFGTLGVCIGVVMVLFIIGYCCQYVRSIDSWVTEYPTN